MNKEKISSQEIIDLVAVKASVSKRAAEEFLKVMISSIEDALLADDSVKVKGFGTFKLQWNEPRKSVNVQTGDEIILDGFYKVVFAPEISLRELVNEPFAHLEAVELDSDNNFILQQKEEEPPLDPLRIFTEQASEIKDLLSEIRALSTVSELAAEIEMPVDVEYKVAKNIVASVESESLDDVSKAMPVIEIIPEIIVVEPEIAIEVLPEVVSETVVESQPYQEPEIEIEAVPIVEEKEKVIQPVAVLAQEPLVESEKLESTPFLAGVKYPKKSKSWLARLCNAD